MSDLQMPKFANEAEEADWWYEHREQVGQEIVRASREGRTGDGSAARLMRLAELRRQAADQPAASGLTERLAGTTR